MLTIYCPHCSKAYRLSPEHVGKSVRCQSCNQVFVAQGDGTGAAVPSFMEEDALNEVPSRGLSATTSPAATSGPSRSYQAPPGKQGISDQIDYCIHGDDTQYVEVTLDPGETVIAESGAMMYMTSGIEMQTVFGDPSSNGGFLEQSR